jgi:carboxyl-terminal processing protease
VKDISRSRVENDSVFNAIRKHTEWLAKHSDREYSLQLDTYRKEQKELRSVFAQMDSLTRLREELDVAALSTETDRWADDKAKQERFQNWLRNLRKDIYLDQAVKVVDDIINQQNLAKAGQATKGEEKGKKAF